MIVSRSIPLEEKRQRQGALERYVLLAIKSLVMLPSFRADSTSLEQV